MAFTSTVTERTSMRNKRVHYGTFDGGGDSGGDIDTGLRSVEFISLTPLTTAPAEAPAVAETLPCDGSAVTIACGADVDGYWMAIGV